MRLDPHSRRKFLLLTGGTGTAAAVLAACGEDEESTTAAGTGGGEDVLTEMFGEGDLGIVNYALTLEYLEAAFYAAVASSGLFAGDDLALIEEIGANEDEHVAALEATAKKLGKPAPEPETKFDLKDARTVLETAAEVENLGAAAYLGQAAAIEDEAILAAALSIHSVEGRHAAALNQLVGQTITPSGAFAKPADAETVLADVEPFIVTEGSM
jgi:rubrerythrin